MKIAWIQDMDPMVSPGGAEMNDRAMIIAGLRRGHDISILTQGNAHEEHQALTADLVILSNAVTVPMSLYDALAKENRPYAFFFHDYGPWLCKWRLFYPMEERCRTICYLRSRWIDHLLRAKLMIWLSPLHRWAWLWGEPRLEAVPHALVPSALNPDLFHDLGGKRKDAIAVHSGLPFKGWPRVRAWAEEHPETPLTLVGPDLPSDAPKSVRLQGPVPYGKMNELYNQHETFLHLPDRPMPFDRTVPEAYLAGCKIVGNSLVGALSWPWFQEGRDAVRRELKAAPTHFWEAMEGVR